MFSEKFLETIKQYDMLTQGQKILCGFSGGADSIAMLCAFFELSQKLNITVCAAHLNHMLRGEEADRDESFAKDFCKKQKIDFYSESINIPEISKTTGEGTELAARNERYKFFNRALKKLSADVIATAHNADDNVETVLLNLIRGSGLKGVCGIPPKRGNIIRPLINITRTEIENYLKEKEIPYIEDKTNFENEYNRNKIRHFILPVLREINSKAVDNIAENSRLLRIDEDYLNFQRKSVTDTIKASNDVISINCKTLLALHPSIRSRVIISLAKSAGAKTQLTSGHINDIYKLAESKSPSNRLTLPGGLTVYRRYEDICFKTHIQKNLFNEQVLDINAKIVLNGWSITCHKLNNNEDIENFINTFYINCDKIRGDIRIRPRRTGDFIKLKGRPRKTIKKLFIDEKVPLEDREFIPVITDEAGVIAICGFGADENYLAEINRDVLCIEIGRIREC